MAQHKLNRNRLDDATRIIADELNKFKVGRRRKGSDLTRLKQLEDVVNTMALVTFGMK